MKIADALSGFYAVLDRDDETLARTLLGSGAKVLQIRIKPEVPLGARMDNARPAIVQMDNAGPECVRTGSAALVPVQMASVVTAHIPTATPPAGIAQQTIVQADSVLRVHRQTGCRGMLDRCQPIHSVDPELCHTTISGRSGLSALV